MFLKKKDKKPNFKQEQLIALQEIGSILNQTRTEKKLSLSVIAQETCISKRLLKAIEKGNLDSLPPGIYTQGFIRRFAQTLDLDGVELSQRFPIQSYGTFVNTKSWWQFPVFQLRTFHLYLFYILVVAFSVKGLSTALERSLMEGNGTSIASSETIIENQDNSVAKNVVNPENLSVKIQLQDQSWVEIVVDGKTEFKGELPKGTNRTWSAKQELTLRTGNAGGVLVALNDQQAQKLGQPGQIQEVTYKAP